MRYEVIVKNIGTVYRGDDQDEAYKHALSYVLHYCSGRAESPVVIIDDEDIIFHERILNMDTAEGLSIALRHEDDQIIEAAQEHLWQLVAAAAKAMDRKALESNYAGVAVDEILTAGDEDDIANRIDDAYSNLFAPAPKTPDVNQLGRRLMAAIETPDDLTDKEVTELLEDAHQVFCHD